MIEVRKGTSFSSSENRNIEIILCTAGSATIYAAHEVQANDIFKGTSFVIPSAMSKYTIKGNATLFKATVPV
ncbi:MAG: hypothetical protein ACE5EK_06795 [Nitrospinales bacterium]